MSTGGTINKRRSDRLVIWSDLAATSLFALEGATVAVGFRLDLFGVLVVAFVTALGGGMIRDALMGDNPPAAIRMTRYAIAAFTAMLLGMITAVGGGVLRDLLVSRVPLILVAEIYASAAFVGAAVMVLGYRRFGRPGLMMLIGGTVCFALRMITYWQDWNLPHAPFWTAPRQPRSGARLPTSAWPAF